MLKKLLKQLKEAEQKADAAENAMMENIEDDNLEKAFDDAYKAEHEIMKKVIAHIVKISGGAIDEKTARLMIMKKRDRLEALAEKTNM